MEKKKKKMKILFAPGFKKSFDKCFSGNPIYSIPRLFSSARCEIKWAWQRVFRGYDDNWYWDLYGRLDWIMPLALRELKKGHGCPSILFDKKDKKNECHKWEEILEKIALGFEAHKKINEDFLYKGKKFEKLNKQYEEGMKLFLKWYSNLWD